MNITQQPDLRAILLEVLSDTRLLKFIACWQRLSHRKQRALLRFARILTT